MNDTKSTKKLYIILTAIILVITTIIVILLTNNSTNKVIISNKNSKQLMNTNALTMMYETDYQSGEYQVTNNIVWPQDGYTFNSNLSKCENGSTLTWDDENNIVLLQTNRSDKCFVYFDKSPTIENLCSGKNLAECINTYVYTGVDGENDLYYHDGQGTYTNANQEANDYSYRYSGANPNNYVCFGSDEERCSADSLYRIIGVFDDQVKLIKYEYATIDLLGTNGDYDNIYPSSESIYYKGSNNIESIGAYLWESSNMGTWSESNLNSINLNTNYLNYFDNKWQNLISEHPWIIGGNAATNIYGVSIKQTYINEIISPAAATTYNAKVGLMYVSDYGYGASPDNWNINMESLNTSFNRENNWIFMGLKEWTISKITPSSPFRSEAFFISNDGGVTATEVGGQSHSIRPVFFLNSNVAYVSGSGTQSDPFRIA